jgi:uncharacterized membrane-anchored protein
VLKPHPLRDKVLAEAHARPFQAAATPTQFIHFAFASDADQNEHHTEGMTALCRSLGAPPPPSGAKHHYVDFRTVGLRWEQHAEFITYTWEFRKSGSRREALEWMNRALTSDGHLVSIDLRLEDRADEAQLEKGFDASSLAMSFVSARSALAATDFRPDNEGFVTLRVSNLGLSDIGAGALVQRLLELETYRVLALLGLFEARRVAPSVRGIERALSQLISVIREDTSHSCNEAVLDELIKLAAALEADGIAAQYRFAASKAYNEIVQGRIAAIGEEVCGSRLTFASFMSRRLDPAMRTCFTMERRQAELAAKLARTAELLRTRVNCEIERQSRDSLRSLNNRTRSQYRLQRAVERISIAAISYYVVALLSYVFAGFGKAGVGWDHDLETAASIPIVLLVVGFLFAALHRHGGHGGDDHGPRE